MVSKPQRLELGEPSDGHLAGGEQHTYEVALEAGHYLDVAVEQRGVDVVVDLVSPDGDRVTRVDSPNHEHGFEEVAAVAEVRGEFTVVVRAARDDAPRGPYRIELRARRPASRNDRGHAEARLAFDHAEAQRRSRAYREASGHYETALAFWKVIGDRRWQAEAHSRLGEVHSRMRDTKTAMEHYRDARNLFGLVDRPLDRAMATNALSGMHRGYGAISQAITHAEEALAVFREMPGPAEQTLPLQAAAWLNLGLAQLRTDDLDDAIQALSEAHEIAGRTRDRHRQARALHSTALALLLQGRFPESAALFERALTLRRELRSRRDQASTLARLADVYFRLGELDAAREHAEEALDIYRQLGARWQRWTAMTLSVLGNTLLESGRSAEAIAAYREASTLASARGSARDVAMARLHLGRGLAATGASGEAIGLFHDALSRFQAIGDSRGEAAAHYGCARIRYAEDDLTSAHVHLAAAIDRAETARVETTRYDLRTAYFASKQNYYDLMIETLMRLDDQAEDDHNTYAAHALDISERRRARTLIDRLRDQRVSLRRGVDPELLEQESGLQTRLNELERSALALADAGAERDDRRRRRIETAQTDTVLQLEAVQARIRRASPHFAALTQPRPLTTPGIQNLLDAETAMLVFSLGERESFLWILTADRLIAHRGLPSRERVALDVDHLRRSMRAGAEPLANRDDNLFLRFSQRYLGPARDVLADTRRLVIVADGALALLPFAALPDPVDPTGDVLESVIARRQVIYLPSASALAISRRDQLERPPRPEDRHLAIVADPVFSISDGRLSEVTTDPSESAELPIVDETLRRAATDVGLDFSELPHTREELAIVRALVPTEQRFEAVGFAATPQNLKGGALAGYAIVHFATHGLVHPQHPELSGLVLSLIDRQGRSAGGFLNAHEIFDLEIDADLVVLSACETGLGRESRGEGIEGLMRSFLHAGVPRIVASLWKVSDRSTAELMRRFYYFHLQHRQGMSRMPPAAALRCAQASMASEEAWKDPYHWAGFVFYGDWRTQPSQTGDDPIEEYLAGDVDDDPTIETDLPDPDDDRCPPAPAADWPFAP